MNDICIGAISYRVFRDLALHIFSTISRLALASVVLVVSKAALNSGVARTCILPKRADRLFVAACACISILSCSGASNVQAKTLTNPMLLIHGIWSNATTWDAMANNMVQHGLTYGGVIQATEVSSGQVGVDSYPSTAHCVTATNRPGGNADLEDPNKPIYLSACLPDADFYIWESSDYALNPFLIANDGLTFSQLGGEVKFAMDFIKGSLTTPASQSSLKFALVGHSMGGLAARHYMQNLHRSGANYANDVATLITVGTPHQGSFVASACDLIDNSPAAGLNACATSLVSSVSALLSLGATTLEAAIDTGNCVLHIAASSVCTKPSVDRLRTNSGALAIMNDCLLGGVTGLCSAPAVSTGVAHGLPSNVGYYTLTVGGGVFAASALSDPYANHEDGLVLKSAQRLPASAPTLVTVVDLPNATARGGFAHRNETSDPNVICTVAGLVGRPCLAVFASSSTLASTVQLRVAARVSSYFASGGQTAVDAYFKFGTSALTLDRRVDAASILVANSATSSSGFSANLTFPTSVAGQTVYWQACVTSPVSAPNGKCSKVQSYRMPDASLPVGQTTASLTLPAPTSLLPNGAGVSPVPLTLSWSQVANATSYRVLVAKASDVASMPSTSNTEIGRAHV